jgi:hypothetical protein
LSLASRRVAGANAESIVAKGRAAPMAQQIETPRTAEPGNILTGYRWLATVFAALVIAQAFLGTRGYFGKPDLVTVHEMVANTMFLLAVAQTVLAWLLYSRRVIGMTALAFNGLLVLLTIAQIGLGYSATADNGKNLVSLISLHIPNGVLLMGVSTVLAVMAWQVGSRRTIA